MNWRRKIAFFIDLSLKSEILSYRKLITELEHDRRFYERIALKHQSTISELQRELKN